LGESYGHRVLDPAAGECRIEVDSPKTTSPYSFTSYVKPAGQSSDYQISQAVSEGLIGGVSTPGAVPTSASAPPIAANASS